MDPKTINLKMSIGTVVPETPPSYITEALQSVEVTHSDNGPSVFQLNFNADRTKGLSQDYKLLSSPLLKTGHRVLLTVSINGMPHVLMDGFITRQELAHTRQSSAATLTVTGEDVSVMMDTIAYSLEYPEMPDMVIAGVVLAKYAAFGIIPKIHPSPAILSALLVHQVPQQNDTDRNFLNTLAQLYGYVFYVRPGPEPLMNQAYWGPPIRDGQPQKALSIDQGPTTNVESINFTFDATAPTFVAGFVEDTDTEEEEEMPVVTLVSTRLPWLAAEPALKVTNLLARKQLFVDPRYGFMKAMIDAQSTTDQSTDRVVVGQGQLDTIRYGEILEAPGLVAVRGVGYSYNGIYYVQQVKHTIRRGVYTQDFTLTREGVGSTITEV